MKKENDVNNDDHSNRFHSWFSTLQKLVDWINFFFNYFCLLKKIMINWYYSLIWWHHSSNTLTLASHIRKESFVKQKPLHFLHASCTRNALDVLQHKTFVDLLSWSSAFDFYKYDSKRAIFDVDYQVWNASFLKLFQKFKVLMFFASEH